MLQVSRDSSLKIPKQIEVYEKSSNSVDDTVAVKKAIATANDKKLNTKELKEKVELEDKELEAISKIPSNSNDLIVITVVKKLGAYVIAVTEKSPKKFRGVFINRMQNYCLDTLEFLLEANFIRMDSLTNKTKREELQKEAIVKLKLLGYVAMVAENSGCILNRQYKQISMQLAEAINLIVAWKKSDDERWRKH
ncbi:MAG: four helix bundle protein [Bacilli bacterium]|nr:four helix bundle protein [Bacilli bacterium]